MSRGGRGGGRGGRPNFPFDHDPALKLDTKPSELFPPYRVPVAEPPTEKEKREVTFYLDLREQIHQGPFYTKSQIHEINKPFKTYGEDQMNELYENKSNVDVDPFEGVPRYTWKYDQKKREIPQLSGLALDRSLFPPELWSTVEGEEGDAVRSTINRGMRKKADLVPGSSKKSSNFSSVDRTQMLIDKIKTVVDDDPDAEVERDEEELDPEEEERDYDYEDDEAEMGGDYGAEQYFDGGDGEEDDGGDGGGGDDF